MVVGREHREGEGSRSTLHSIQYSTTWGVTKKLFGTNLMTNLTLHLFPLNFLKEINFSFQYQIAYDPKLQITQNYSDAEMLTIYKYLSEFLSSVSHQLTFPLGFRSYQEGIFAKTTNF